MTIAEAVYMFLDWATDGYEGLSEALTIEFVGESIKLLISSP